jgi:hypothetical protein
VTAQPIAELVADLLAGRYRHPGTRTGIGLFNDTAAARLHIEQPVVDITPIYRDVQHRLQVKQEAVAPYDDHPCITPPWTNALLCFVNEHQNTHALQIHTEPWGGRQPWKTVNDPDIDWDRVRWKVDTFVWTGGRSKNLGEYIPTGGPMHYWRYALYEDGQPADLGFIQLLSNMPAADWDITQLTLLGALNFLNCVNIDVDEPARPRPERRRIARTGITVKTLVVHPVGRRRPGTRGTPLDPAETAQSKVRGHFAHYGDRYGKGKLFGKYEGKFWVPPHVRGSAEVGEIHKDYLLKP